MQIVRTVKIGGIENLLIKERAMMSFFDVGVIKPSEKQIPLAFGTYVHRLKLALRELETNGITAEEFSICYKDFILPFLYECSKGGVLQIPNLKLTELSYINNGLGCKEWLDIHRYRLQSAKSQ